MKKIKFSLFILILLPSLSFSEEWHVKKSETNIVKFISSTSLLDFEGTTSNVDGYIYWEGDDFLGDKSEVYIEVDLNSVETGIGKRDRDMREDVLETDKWAKTYFKGEVNKVTKMDSSSGDYKISAIGNMFIHGKEKELEIIAQITTVDGLMNVVCDFSVFLNDYDIEAPSLLAFVKVAEEIKLHLEIQLEKIVEGE